MRKLMGRLMIGVMAGALGLASGSVRAEDNAGGSGETIGTFKAMARKVLLQFVPEGPDGVALKQDTALVSDKTEVTLDGNPSTFSELKPGMTVRFATAELEGLVTKVEAFALPPDDKERKRTGVVENARWDTLTLSKDQNKYPFVVGPQTKVTLDGKVVGLEELRHGMITTVTYRKGVPTKVESITAEMDGVMHRCEGEFVSGTSEELVMHVWGSDGFDIKFKLGNEFKITRDGKPATMADFHSGEKVVANYTDGVAADLTVSQSGNRGR
jgi:hypothetical protein